MRIIIQLIAVAFAAIAISALSQFGPAIVISNAPPGRGVFSSDLQSAPGLPGRTASGSFSSVLGGSNNQASGVASVVLGGSLNRVYGRESVAGGSGNISSNSQMSGANNLTIAIDCFNFGDRSVILGGKDNWINGAAGGFPSNQPSLFDSCFIGGSYLTEIQNTGNSVGSGMNTILGGWETRLIDTESCAAIATCDGNISNSVRSVIMGPENNIRDTTNKIAIGFGITDSTPESVSIGTGKTAVLIRDSGVVDVEAIAYRTPLGPQIVYWDLSSAAPGDALKIHSTFRVGQSTVIVVTNSVSQPPRIDPVISRPGFGLK